MIYPNLELMVYRFENYLNENKIDDRPYHKNNTDVIVFPQMWPNTGGGFARKGYMYGQAMTKQYTTIVMNAEEDCAIVFFDGSQAYYVSPLTQSFYDDIKRRSMVGVDCFTKYSQVKDD